MNTHTAVGIDPARQAWVLLAILTGGAGALFLALAWVGWRDAALLLLCLGAGQVAVSAWAFQQRVWSSSPSVSSGRRGSELGLLLTMLPYCVLLVWTGVEYSAARSRAVSGRPVEVRSESRTVHMPGGQVFRYTCWKDEGKGSGDCPAEARWAALPRWPEPRRVEMRVSGNRIRDLVMDGVVVVDEREFSAGDYIGRTLLIGGGLVGASIALFGIRRRLRP
jgi:hypothetical protein